MVIIHFVRTKFVREGNTPEVCVPNYRKRRLSLGMQEFVIELLAPFIIAAIL